MALDKNEIGTYRMVVESITDPAIDIRHITLKTKDGSEVFETLGGSNMTLDLPMPQKIRKNTYSIVRRTADKKGYEIAVLKAPNGKGSVWIHEELNEGDELITSTPGNMFPINSKGKHHILFAGGIGITPMISYIEWFERYGGDKTWELHYASRAPENAFYYKELQEKYGDRVTMYFESEKNFVDMKQVMMDRPAGTNAYICGPAGMIAAYHEIGESLGWPDQAVHSEAFSAAGGKAFKAVLAKSGKTIEVKDTQTLLEAIEDADVEVPNVCRGGGCGFCKVKVNKGLPEHRDFFLSDQEKEENDAIMVCVSRCLGEEIELDI